jgi:hypothetical protein
MTHYQLKQEPKGILWNECDSRHKIFRTVNDGFLYELVDEENQVKTFPDINRGVIVKTKTSIWRTIFLSEFERKHVVMKWNITGWSYEEKEVEVFNMEAN